jgi:hypothetical protein
MLLIAPSYAISLGRADPRHGRLPSMPDDLTVYRLFVAAPSDVRSEQTAIRDVVAAWNAMNSHHVRIAFEVVSWLTHSVPELGGPPQEILNRQLVESADILVGVFWTRVGTKTAAAASGTVEEIELFRSMGKPAALFFSDRPARPSLVNSKQYDELCKFRVIAQQWGLYSTYSTIPSFRDQFSRLLTSWAHKFRETGSTPPPIREYLTRWQEFDIRPDINASRVRTSRASFYTALQFLMGGLEAGSRVISSDSLSSKGENGMIYWVTEGLQFLGLTHAAAQRGIQFERVFIVTERDMSSHSKQLVALCHMHNLAGVRTYLAPYEGLPVECLYEYVIFGDQYVDEAVYDIEGERIIENWIYWSEQKMAACADRSKLLMGFSKKAPTRWKAMADDFGKVTAAAELLRQSLVPVSA